ncbi:MAG: PAS domain-containing protein, partial [Chloroflexota bacterium]
ELNGLQTSSHCLGINYLELCDSASGQNSEEASLTSRAIRDVLAAVQQEARIEYPCDGPNEKRWFLLKVTKFEADGEVWAVLSHENITERKRTEQALMEKEEQYRAIAESSSDFIMRYDRNFKHIYANRIALESTGLPVEQYIGKTHHEMGFPEHLCKLWEQHIQSVFDTGKSSQMEFAVEMAPGIMHLDLVFNPEFSPDGNVNSVIGISRNISERKQAEAQKQAAFEALQQKNDEMERFQHITIGRELRMIELKKEINHLLQQTGLPEKYRIVDEK